MGILTISSHLDKTAWEMPKPSEPMTKAIGRR
jgi:hypothetical protein